MGIAALKYQCIPAAYHPGSRLLSVLVTFCRLCHSARYLCRFCQVVPEDRNQPWIAGQQSAACGLVGNDTLLAVGGYGPHRKPENDVLAKFTFTSGPALALHASVAKQGVHLHTSQEGVDLTFTFKHKHKFPFTRMHSLQNHCNRSSLNRLQQSCVVFWAKAACALMCQASSAGLRGKFSKTLVSAGVNGMLDCLQQE